MAGERTRTRTRTTATPDGSTAVGGAPDETEETITPTPDAPTPDAVGADEAGLPPESTVEHPEGSTVTAADIAAKRRRQLDKTPGAHPQGAVPAAIDGEVPRQVVASRATIDGLTVDGSPVRPAGGVWSDEPVVLENMPGAAGGATPVPNYVISEFDAIESTVMPGDTTPVSRRRWNAGMLVRRDVYEAVLAEHRERVAAGTARDPEPARLPAHITRVPPDVVATGPGQESRNRAPVTVKAAVDPVAVVADQGVPVTPVVAEPAAPVVDPPVVAPVDPVDAVQANPVAEPGKGPSGA